MVRQNDEPLLPVGSVWEEQIPRMAAMARGMTDPGVWASAMRMYYAVMDPVTGALWVNTEREVSARNSVEQEAASCQKVAIDKAQPHDNDADAAAHDAGQHADSAIEWMDQAEKAFDDSVLGPDGAQITGHELRRIHELDNATAKLRAGDGDTRHLQRPVTHAWFTLSAVLLALLDVFLLWKPILGLGSLSTSGMLVKWLIGGAFAGAQALMIDRSLAAYLHAERASVDRRAVVADYNRGVRRRDSKWFGQEPDRQLVESADRRLVARHRLLCCVATLVAIVGGVRVAYLARSGGLPLIESALFAVVLAITLGALVMLLGWAGARGNQLSDRLQLGARELAAIGERIEECRGRVGTERELANGALAASEQATALADDIRERVSADYRSAVLLFCAWTGINPTELGKITMVTRTLPIAVSAEKLREEVRATLSIVSDWLDHRTQRRPEPTPAIEAAEIELRNAETAGTALATNQASNEANVSSFHGILSSLAPPPPNSPDVLVERAGLKLRDEPATPAMWLAVGCVLASVAAVAAAMFIDGPGDTGPVKLGAPPAAVQLAMAVAGEPSCPR